MIIVFVGPPGAGKGTQSNRVTEHFEIPHLSTGAMLRRARAIGTEIGKKVGPILDSGGLVDDDLIVGVVKERVQSEDCQNGYLIDGFPRTIPQAQAFDAFLGESNATLTCVVELCVPEEELTRRLLNRFEEMDNPRPEDQPDAIPRRLGLYQSQTSPILAHYDKQRLLLSVDGIGSMDEVFDRIIQGINAMQECGK